MLVRIFALSIILASLACTAQSSVLPVEIECRSDHAAICDQADSRLLAKIPDQFPILQQVLANPERYKVQIQVSQIVRDPQQQPHLISYRLFVDDERYFYPASTVKLPVTLLALEWLQQQAQIGLDSTFHTYASRDSQQMVTEDVMAVGHRPTLAHYIWQVMMVSDNPGFNRMYELLGQDYINQQLRSKGLSSATINHRLSLPMSAAENRHYNPLAFFNAEHEVILQLPARSSQTEYPNQLQPKLGSAFYQNGELINEPMGFSDKNRLSIQDLSGVVERLIFPELFPQEQQFHLEPDMRDWLLAAMLLYPSESKQPDYAAHGIADNRYKYIKFGGQPTELPRNQRWLNKIGSAYGFLTDAGYFVDLEQQLEFFVTATIYVNANQTLNDDTYEYQQIGLPFHRELGEYLYQQLSSKPNQHKPDLSHWQLLLDQFVQ
ncbi:serine hydrolase [Alkalimonas amylolytica]|uniref:Beta-lactamase class A n=1 Tax=Alkalimonas amylolytica TaxID=152573 RepID=A0A1H4FI00_ALKAM|nr:serine hydrolase [Alkalimonas amylolytica]SEA96979.1 Beta-lactamase class A [Alkalimonas amylolytica]